MANSKAEVSRRSMLTLATAGLAAGAATPALAASAGEEAANAALVQRFCEAWSADPLDIDGLVNSYIAEDCVVRVMDGAMTANGRAAVLAMFKGWLEGARRFELKVLSAVALGPIVINTRVDSVVTAAGAPHGDHIASVFVIANGKIRVWEDYFI